MQNVDWCVRFCGFIAFLDQTDSCISKMLHFVVIFFSPKYFSSFFCWQKNLVFSRFGTSGLNSRSVYSLFMFTVYSSRY